MKNRTRHLARGLLTVLATGTVLFLCARLYYTLTDDFRLSNITEPLPYEQTWEVPTPPPDEEAEINDILKQTFTYLGKGAQSYAFTSADGLYVIKFFKFKHLRPSFFVDNLPPVGFIKTYQEQQAARKTRKLFGVFRSYKLAYDTNREYSGLIFIQLNTENNPQYFVTLIDKLGFKHTIDLSKVPFILQYKGQTLRNVLTPLLKEGELRSAEEKIGQIIDMYAAEYAKGVFDHDHGVMQNTGFVGNQPIHLDVGKLMKEEKMRDPSFSRQDILLVTFKINHWVTQHFPQYSTEIASFIQKKIDESWPSPN